MPVCVSTFRCRDIIFLLLLLHTWIYIYIEIFLTESEKGAHSKPLSWGRSREILMSLCTLRVIYMSRYICVCVHVTIFLIYNNICIFICAFTINAHIYICTFVWARSINFQSVLLHIIIIIIIFKRFIYIFMLFIIFWRRTKHSRIYSHTHISSHLVTHYSLIKYMHM